MDVVEGAGMAEEQHATRTAAEAGWHVSRYNIRTRIPETGKTVIVNLLKGTCLEYSPIELYLMSVLDEISESHPIINLLAKRGAICDYDEVAAIEAGSHILGKRAQAGGLVICPTMGCNFDCPYCFENHYAGRMSASVQDDVISLAERLVDANAAKTLKVTWFGGEPLLAPEVIESLSERLIALTAERGIGYEANIITNGYLLDQDMIDRLARCKVSAAQITLDGLGASHDSTRHLLGGGPTFERIVRNLHECDIPFCVFIRHNVHEDNRREMGELESFVRQLSEESGNEMHYFSARVVSSEAAEERGRQVRLLCDTMEAEVALEVDSRRFGRGRAAFCGANEMGGVAIDHLGNLYQCWEVVGNQRFSFGTAREWDPENPLTSASRLDMLTCYLNAFGVTSDPECRSCLWLPHCAGGCPHKRLFGSGRQCVPYRDDPEAYARASYANLQAIGCRGLLESRSPATGPKPTGEWPRSPLRDRRSHPPPWR